MAAFKPFKVVAALPTPLQPDSVYFVRVGTGVDLYVTNHSGTVAAYRLNFATLDQGALADSAIQPNAMTSAIGAAINALKGELLGGAPDALNAFNELSTALGNDPNFATTMLNALAAKPARAEVLNADGNYRVHDTRNVDTPTDIGEMGVRFDFKGAGIGGLSAIGGNFYATMTLQQWNDQSGDSTYALAFLPNGDVLSRYATIGSSWSSYYTLWSSRNFDPATKLNSSAKASAAEIRAGTDDTKFATPAAIAQAMAFQTINPGSPDLAAAINGKVTLTATSTTFGGPTGHVPGQTGALRIQQNATGNRTASWNTFWDFGADGPPTLSTAANKVDWVFYVIDDSGTKAVCSFKAGA